MVVILTPIVLMVVGIPGKIYENMIFVAGALMSDSRFW